MRERERGQLMASSVNLGKWTFAFLESEDRERDGMGKNRNCSELIFLLFFVWWAEAPTQLESHD